MAIVVMTQVGARADQVTVYVQDASVIPARPLSKAQVLANEIFAGAGVEIDWHRYTAISLTIAARVVDISRNVYKHAETPLTRRACFRSS